MSVHYPPLHPTDASFADIRERDGLYVDKTHHFRNLLATDPQPRGGPPALTTRHQFLVRPRRFGKTLLINTLEAWFQGLPPDLSERLDPHAPTFTGRREGWSSPDWLWEGLDTADWHGAHGWHPVVRLDMSRRTPDNPADMQRCLQRQMMHLVNLWVHRGVPREHFWDPPLPDDTPGDILTSLLEALGSCYRAPPVVLVDEYDAPVTHYLGRDVDAAPALDALRELYRVLKDDAGLLYGVLVTGITRLAKPYLFSAANNFKDISSISTYADLCGFTENEVDRDLAPYRAALREKEPAFDETTMLAQWREMYNGYRFSRRPDTKRVYNPYTLTYGLDLTLSDVETREHALQGKWPSAWSETAHPALAVRLAADTRQTLPVGVREGAPTLSHPGIWTTCSAPTSCASCRIRATTRGTAGRMEPNPTWTFPTAKWQLHGSATSWTCGPNTTVPMPQFCSTMYANTCTRATWMPSPALWNPSTEASPIKTWTARRASGPCSKPCASKSPTTCRPRSRRGARSDLEGGWATTSRHGGQASAEAPPKPCFKSGIALRERTPTRQSTGTGRGPRLPQGQTTRRTAGVPAPGSARSPAGKGY